MLFFCKLFHSLFFFKQILIFLSSFLAANEIGSEGAMYFAQVLKVNRTLKFLDLGGFFFSFSILSLLNAPDKKEKHKEKSDFSSQCKGNKIDDKEAKYIGEALKVNETLQTLECENTNTLFFLFVVFNISFFFF
jgi:hypothetical protein